MSFIEFKKPDELELREGFLDKSTFNKATENLDHIVGWFHFDKKDWYQDCCLCGNSHGKGYLVKLESSSESIIGHICGERVFGEKFESQHLSVKKWITDDKTQKALLRLIGEADALDKQIDDLINGEFGYNKLQAQFKQFKKHHSKAFVDGLINKAKTQKFTVSKIDPLTEQQIRMRDEGDTIKRTYSTIGSLKGAAYLVEHEKLNDLLIQKGKKLIEQARSLDPDTLNQKTINKWVEDLLPISRNIEAAEGVINKGWAFFTRSNYQMLYSYCQYELDYKASGAKKEFNNQSKMLFV